MKKKKVNLTKKQSRAFRFLTDNVTNEILFGGGAGGGKSLLGCVWSIWLCLRFAGIRGLIGRSSLKTLRETTLQTFFEAADMMGVSHTFKYIAPTTIKFHNGSEIILKDLFYYPQDPNLDELGSLELTFAFIDEANQILAKVKNVVRSRLRFKLDVFGLIPKILYTCNPAHNWTKIEFHDPHRKKTLPKSRAFVQSLAIDNPHIFSGYVDALGQLDESNRQRLLFGNWDFEDSANSLILRDRLLDLFSNEYVKADGKKYITVDVARMGKDKTVIRVWHGWRVIERVVIAKGKTTFTEIKVKELAKKYSIPMSQVICDEDGVGGGVVDHLNCKGFVANKAAVQQVMKADIFNYATIKDQCGYHVASMINQGKVFERADTDVEQLLTEELSQLKEQNIGSDGKRRLISKDEIKLNIGRSPDDLDTYIMRAWFDVVAPSAFMRTNASQVPTQQSKYRSDFNP